MRLEHSPLPLRAARVDRRGSPTTQGASRIMSLGIVMPDGDYIPLCGYAVLGAPAARGPASFRAPGAATTQRDGILFLWRLA